jgi:indole-3-glycerol phosphate synthase
VILDDIAASTRKRVENARNVRPFEQVRDTALAVRRKAGAAGAAFPFEEALSPTGAGRTRTAGPAFICEVKKASPSRGLIAKGANGEEAFPYLDIAREYEAVGAEAVSVLTEPDYFLGSDSYLREIAATVKIPALRKDFIIDEYQIYEAAILGAKAVLLICALLSEKQLSCFFELANGLRLSALVEAHTVDEVKIAANCGARIIGINNRDLKTFTVDINTTAKLREYVPDGVITVSESGIRSPDDVRFLCGFGVDGFLIGEAMMIAPDRKRYLCALREAGLAGRMSGQVQGRGMYAGA